MWSIIRKPARDLVLKGKGTVKECGNCIHWYKGPCRRYPPVPVDAITSRFPITKKENVCGEWYE